MFWEEGGPEEVGTLSAATYMGLSPMFTGGGMLVYSNAGGKEEMCAVIKWYGELLTMYLVHWLLPSSSSCSTEPV